MSVATKCDVLTDEQMEIKRKRLHEYNLEHLVEEQRHQSQTRRRHLTAPESCSNTKLIINYCCELETWSDESIDPVQPMTELDTELLALWRDIVARTAACGGAHRRKKVFSASQSKSVFRCLPFRLQSPRSNSF